MKELSKEGKNAIAIALTGATLGAVAAGAAAMGPEQSREAQASQATANAIAQGRPVGLLEGGTATVQLEDGKKYMKITDPIMGKGGVVLDHAEGEGKVATGYLSEQTDTDDTDPNAKTISYTVDGKPVSEKQAVADARPTVINNPGSTSTGPNAYFTIADNQPGAGQHVAQGTPEHAVVTTAIVPNSPDSK